ncbi:MAG: hypothetical protein RIQ78_795 [Bacteroidota bacterium]|jgi:hypothetical protein
MKQQLFGAMILLATVRLQAQTVPATVQDTLYRGGAWARLEVENGDSTFIMALRPVKISARRAFKDLDEQRQFWLYTRSARRVYPYALQAIGLYEQIQDETEDMSKRKRKRFIRHEHQELKEDMTETLKNLSKTDGKVLIKMIERQLDKPFYEVVRETRGSFTATYWNTMSKMWGYDLKDGYHPGADLLLDDVLLDYDFGDPYTLYGN